MKILNSIKTRMAERLLGKTEDLRKLAAESRQEYEDAIKVKEYADNVDSLAGIYEAVVHAIVSDIERITE